MFKVAREAVRLELERMRNKKFLDATMAASALIATADGVVEFQELVALDSVIANVYELSIFKPHTGIDIYRRYAQSIIDTPQDGTDKALKSVARLSDDPDAAKLLIRACIAIGRSDGDFSQSEAAMIEKMCGVLDVDPNDPAFSSADES
jgi:tellurite resistance protein TerB